jgi:SPFH domain / Band 7 family
LPSLVCATFVVWFLGATNPVTPAGNVGYFTKGAVFGKSRFYGVQRGPTSPGRHWLLHVSNVSITPYTYTEDVTRDPDAVVKIAHGNFVREPLRTFVRDEVQRRNGLDIKEAFIPIGDAVLSRIRQYADNSPFIVTSVVVGNVQYPAEVADAVSRKLAATQELQRQDTEIEIERKERTKREIQAQGIANAMQIIRGQLSDRYIQHEAIEAQKLMVGSPNHTVVYIPVGPMGVPVVGTFPTVAPSGPDATAVKKNDK